MFGSVVLDVVIGLSFVYFLLGVICTAVTEVITRILSYRAKDLKRGIEMLLQDGAMVEKFYAHPLIKGLTGKKKINDTKDVNQIPPQTFALVFLDLVKGSANVAKDVAELAGSVNAAADGPSKKALQAVVSGAQNEFKQIQKGIEDWFNGAMEQTTLWYKQKAQLCSLIIALVVTLFLNVDTVRIGEALSKDATLRASVVAAAQEAVKTPPRVDNKPNETLKEFDERIAKLGLPVGWWEPGAPGKCRSMTLGNILGLIVTALAVSLGAPFWYDVLKKMLSLRGGGKSGGKEAA